MTASATHAISRIRLAIAGVLLIASLEVVVGVSAGSLALLSDAGHLVTDSATLALTWYALSRSRRPAGASHTFGHHRNGILVAAVNGAFLVVVAAAVAVGAVTRLQHPVTVSPEPVIVVAGLALAVNTSIAYALHGAGAGLGVRSAALHVVADALTDAAVIVGAVAILWFGFTRADAIVSLVIAVLIFLGALRLLGEATHILNEATPRGIDIDVVRQSIAVVPGVEGVHDLHIWSLDREHRALSVHILVANRPLDEVTAMIRSVEQMLCAEFRIEHATVQPECPSCSDEPALYCDLDGRHELVHGAGRH
ncbi:MAG: cation diffusion facilitator family transporter [Candidatus Dormibacteraeota bacterium]|nr:cation diffusion facilitator family transporter [Candidatus Dormibacteraeota bacterium]